LGSHPSQKVSPEQAYGEHAFLPPLPLSPLFCQDAQTLPLSPLFDEDAQISELII
jgi:hypothetical protein